ncbi:hypothetical protein [Rhodoferax aquaticus]|nr:hypothetical protein [Rhodoferax aquaticus]
MTKLLINTFQIRQIADPNASIATDRYDRCATESTIRTADL